MNSAALQKLAVGAAEIGSRLSPAMLENLDRYGEELKKWNKKINLTAITADEEIAIKHFVDSLALAQYLPDDALLLDVGSGAGFPSLPLKIARPQIQVSSIDAVEKKVLFQRHVARLLDLDGFRAIHGRAEDLQVQRESTFDIVVSRAFSDIPTFAAIASPLLRSAGLMIAMKGKDGKAESVKAGNYLTKTGLVVERVEEFDLPFGGGGRSLIFIRKSAG